MLSFSRLGTCGILMTDIFKRHPILKSVLVALIPIGYRSIPNDRTITDLLDGGYRSSTDIVIPHPNNYYILTVNA